MANSISEAMQWIDDELAHNFIEMKHIMVFSLVFFAASTPARKTSTNLCHN